MANKKKGSFLNSISKAITSADRYGESVHFEIQGSDSHKSILGALISIIIFIFCIGFAINKFMIMIQFGDTTY